MSLSELQTAKLLADLPMERTEALQVDFIRELVEADMDAAPAWNTPVNIRQIRQSHHQLARLLAQGAEYVEVSLITGYDLSYIYNIQKNETFQELLAHYRTIDGIAEADIKGQMSSVGQMALEEVRKRLEEGAEDLSYGQLMTTIETFLPTSKDASPAVPTAPVFTMNFVNSATPAARDVIDVTPEEQGK